MVLDWVLNREIKQMIDNYTKVILTVIAVSTSFIAFKDSGLFPSATASGEKVHKIAICNEQGSKCTRIYGGGLGIAG